MENRFRLVHLPIACLNGEQKVMYDTLLRMLDPQGEEVAAAEFMPAAFRNRLQRAIDRWVIGASLLFCAKTPLDCVFIKLSSESLVDKTLLEWLVKAVESAGAKPAQLCFQVSEDDATQYLTQTQELAQQLNARGYLFAVEHFGTGRDSARVLLNTPMQYLKLDGSLMENLATDQSRPSRSASRTRTRWPCSSSSVRPTSKATTCTNPRSCSEKWLRLDAEPIHGSPAARQGHAPACSLARVVREVGGFDHHVARTRVDPQRLFFAEHANAGQDDAVLARHRQDLVALTARQLGQLRKLEHE